MRETLQTWTAAAAALLAAACSSGAPQEGDKRFPISSDYPPGTMERIVFNAGVPEAWAISALQTPARPDAAWKIVIVTGTPSWSEYWAPTLAGAPASREVIVADRPGFSLSQPQHAVRDLAKQADALAPMLAARPGQRVLLVGQSFGAPLATLMAARHPGKVSAVLLVSSFFGDRGPTARRLFGVGRIAQPLLPRDLRNSVSEVSAQAAQLPAVWAALSSLDQPVVFIHGEADSFVPPAAAQRIAAAHGRTLSEIPGGDHFLTACCVPALLDAMERAIAEAEGRASAEPPVGPSLVGRP